jgi:alkylhydroperoxidase family enzyme
MKHELTPVEEPFSAEVSALFAHYPKGQDGYILKLFRVFANSLRFLGAKGVLNLLDKESPLSLRERELIILRVTANRDCEYEWGIHVSVFSRAAGLSEQQVAATRLAGPDAECWTASDSLLLQCVDEICQFARIQDDSYALFQAQWSLQQQLEILALCGNYHTVSFVANTARVPLEEVGERFPQRRLTKS